MFETNQNCPNALECIQTHTNASKCIQTGLNRSENLEKLRKTFRKFAKQLEKNIANAGYFRTGEWKKEGKEEGSSSTSGVDEADDSHIPEWPRPPRGRRGDKVLRGRERGGGIRKL